MSDDWYTPGRQYQFYGVDTNCYKLDDQVFEAIEDEADGYRSYLKSIERRGASGLIFASWALDTVEVRPVNETPVTWMADAYKDAYTEAFDGWELVAADGHQWLLVGTMHADDYYPSFCFRYTPREADTPIAQDGASITQEKQ